MRVVIDTNVFVSGLLGSRVCQKIILSFKDRTFDLVISDILLKELEFVIERAKFQILIDSNERKETISFIKSIAIFVMPKNKVAICRDIKDNKILECVTDSKSNFIITGDKDLLAIKSFHGINIITPSNFLKYLKI